MPEPAPDPAFTPLLRTLGAVMGRRADDPELVAFVTGTLGQKKVPDSTTDVGKSKNVVAKKQGLELVFGHDVKNDRYPLIPKKGKSFVPYLFHAWLRKEFPFGLKLGMSSEEITQRLGVPPEHRGPARLPVWEVVLDAARDVVLRVYTNEITIGVDEANELSSRYHPPKPLVGVFVGWAATRNLLDESRFAAHTDLLKAVRKRQKKGSDLLAAAMPRGVWDVHLKDVPGLRDFAHEWFCNLDDAYIVFDLNAVFGSREGPHGHDEPILDDDDWPAVDKATPKLDERFAKWLGE